MDLIEILTQIFSKTGPILILLGVFIGFMIKLVSFAKRLRKGRDYMWKEKMIKRLLKNVNTSEFIDIMLVLTVLVNVVPAEDLADIINKFANVYELESLIKEAIVDIDHVLYFRKRMPSPHVYGIMKECMARNAALMRSKKRRRNKPNKKVEQAIDGIVGYLNTVRKEKIITAREKGKVDEIEQEIKQRLDESNIMKNRKIRHKIETSTQKAREKEMREFLDKKKGELHDIFKKKN